MVSSILTAEVVPVEAITVVERPRFRRYHWPPLVLKTWLLVMMAASCSIIGIFSTFINVQNQLMLPVPWEFPYLVTVAALVALSILVMLWMMAQRLLLPAVVFVGAFVHLVLWVVGLIVLSLQLWGPTGSVNGTCNIQVFSQNPTGSTLYTLAWLEQQSICQAWQAGFAMSLVGTFFLVWIMFIAYQVFADA